MNNKLIISVVVLIAVAGLYYYGTGSLTFNQPCTTPHYEREVFNGITAQTFRETPPEDAMDESEIFCLAEKYLQQSGRDLDDYKPGAATRVTLGSRDAWWITSNEEEKYFALLFDQIAGNSAESERCSVKVSYTGEQVGEVSCSLPARL